ncbi:hypothetical protein LXL04_007839 [Taraxacum kok-saghyz]
METQNPVQNPEASEFSFKETASSFPILELKNNNLYLNLITVLQPGARYFDDSFKSIFVCLKHSKISTALTLSKSVPISVLSRAYGTARYDKPSESMFFDLATNKSTSITKQHFCKLLNLSVSTELIHPDSVSNVDLINMCNQMGHEPLLETVSKMNKSRMPPRWNLLASIILRCFAERTTGSDNASKLLLTLIYAIYTNQNIDIGQILWTQFCLSPNSNTRTTHISMARFWGIVVDGALNKFKELRGDSNTAMAEVSKLQVNKLQFVKDRVFDHCGEIPLEMWSSVPENEPQKKKVKKDNKGALPVVVLRAIPDDVQERIEALATKKPQVKRKRGDQIETEQVQAETEQPTPKKQKKIKKPARRPSKKSKKTPTLQDEPSDDDEATQSNASHHSEPDQTETPLNKEEGTLKTPPRQPEKDTTFDDLGNIEKLTQTPEDQTDKPSPHQSESEPVDEEIQIEGPQAEMFNPNQATSSTYVKPTDTFTFLPVTFEEEELSAEQLDMSATKKDISSLRTMLNTILVGIDPSKAASQSDLIKNQTEEFNKIDESSKSATNESELKAKVHALELQIKELGTQLESKTHEAEHRLRVIEMYKAQNHETNLKLVKLVEDKDAQVLKLSEKVDAKFEQMMKTLSELSVPKVIEKVIEKPQATSQEGGEKGETEKESTQQEKTQTETTNKPPQQSSPKQSKKTPTKKPDPKPKRPIQKGITINPDVGSSRQKTKEPEHKGRGKMIVVHNDPKATQQENILKDEELARKLQEEERLNAEALKEKEERQIEASKTRIWPVWTRAKIIQVALAEPDPYWLHPIASQNLKFDANYQLDMPICPRAFLFKYMELLTFYTGNDEMLHKILIDFYAKKSKAQQDVWSCTPIKTVLRMRRTNLVGNAFYNWEFDITRGTEKVKSTISFADIPLMNPSDWITIHQLMVLKCEDYCIPHIKVFKLLMQNYLFEMARFDIVAADLMKKTPKKVEPTYFTVNDIVKYAHLMMTDIYTLPPNHLRLVKQKVMSQNRNSEHDKKEVLARVAWHEAVRSKIITFYNFMMEHEEKTAREKVKRGSKARSAFSLLVKPNNLPRCDRPRHRSHKDDQSSEIDPVSRIARIIAYYKSTFLLNLDD